MNSVLNADNTTKFKKPFYSIEFKAIKLGVVIRVNDIPVFNVNNSGFLSLEVPINQFVINGDNEIKVVTYPLFDDNEVQNDNYLVDSSIEVNIYIRENDESENNRILISKVNIQPNIAYIENSNTPISQSDNIIDNNSLSLLSSKKDVDILNYPFTGAYKKQVLTTWKFNNTFSNYPHWSWQDGEQIKNTDETYKSLLAAYSKLHKYFSNKNLDLVKKASEQHSSELSKAYFLNDDAEGFNQSAIGKYIDHKDIKIYDQLFQEHSKLEILADGKMARIMNGADTHPIVFANFETQQLYQLQFLWYKKNNEWILIR